MAWFTTEGFDKIASTKTVKCSECGTMDVASALECKNGGHSLFLEKEAGAATKTDPKLWERAKAEAKAKMGGKHSARAMQLATQIYKKKGGGYSGAKPTAKNNSLKKWGKQKWQWSKEKKAAEGRGVYLPEAKIERLKSSPEGKKKLESAERKKSKATKAGEQYSSHGLAAGTSLVKRPRKFTKMAGFREDHWRPSKKKASRVTEANKKKKLMKIVSELKGASKMHAAQAGRIEKMASVEYRGKTFPGYGKPIASDRKNKKKMVLVKRGDKVKLVHFGQKGYQDFTQHKDKKRQKNYLTRSAGIKNKSGQLTKNDPFSPNYWARRELW